MCRGTVAPAAARSPMAWYSSIFMAGHRGGGVGVGYGRLKRRLNQPPVVLTREWRPVVGAALVEMFLRLESQLLCLSTGGQHVHLLAKMPPGPVPKQWLGRAKKHAHFIADGRGWTGK